jgi:hypothetical protein
MICDSPVATAAALSVLSRDYGEQLIGPPTGDAVCPPALAGLTGSAPSQVA